MKKFENIPDWITLAILIASIIAGVSYQHFRLDRYIEESQKQCEQHRLDMLENDSVHKEIMENFTARYEKVDEDIRSLQLKDAELTGVLTAMKDIQLDIKEDVAGLNNKIDILLGVGVPLSKKGGDRGE